jgi:signal transduction histidine kinase
MRKRWLLEDKEMNNEAKGAAEYTDINLVLSDITNALVGQFNLKELLDKVVTMAMRLLNAEVCSIFLDNKDKRPGYIVMMAGSGFAKDLVGKADYEIGEGLTGFIAKTGRKFNIKSREELGTLIEETTGKSIWKGKQDQHQWPSGESEFRNLIALPLKIKDQIIGVIKVENKLEDAGEYFSSEDERIFEIIANVVALAIENARLYQKIETQLKAISAKAAHRINNQATNYDGIELDLEIELQNQICNKQNIFLINERLKKTTENLKKMITEFKNYGKPLIPQKVRCSFNKIIRDEVWLAKPPSGIKIEVSLDDTIPEILIDEGRFAESIKELISNSMEAVSKNTSGRGWIQLSTELRNETKDDDLLFRIKDNGPGFPPDFPIFEPFNSTDTQSTGLGLATVKELVVAHGGEIHEVKLPGGGACIEFTIPITTYTEGQL